MTDWELWACAAELRERYGEMDASIHAAQRADAMLEADDGAGYRVWITIMVYVAKLGRTVEPGATRH